ncbi:hypothetical protein PG999_002248 [Apiospora kogelbergensis]|uniref:Rhodopsin domain-containing protein n=1 Tax=Apiospora kogelbergensis TaxID=1337665 RepID=A0AAW0R7W1_9PEZI
MSDTMSDTVPEDGNVAATAPDQGKILLAVSILTNVVALWTCIMRVFVNRADKRETHWADRFVGLAMALGSVSNMFILIETVNWDKPQAALEADFFAQPWLMLGATAAKAAICLSLVPLLQPDIWRRVLEIQILVVCVVNCAFIPAILFQCQPMSSFWTPGMDDQCWALHTRHTLEYVQGIVDLFSQLYMAFITLIVVHQYQATARRGLKIGFCFLSVANLTIAVLVMVKMYYISLTTNADRYLPQAIGTILTVLVQNFLIMAANILPITMFFLKDGRPLIQMLTEPLPSTRRSRQNCPESGYFVHFDTASMMSKGDGMSTFSRVSSLRRRSSGTPFYIQTPASQPGAGRKQHVEIDSQQSHIELDGFEHVELDTGSGTTRTVICKVMPGETLLLSPQGRDR